MRAILKQYDHPARILVRYSPKSREHLVDLCEDTCACEHFQFAITRARLEGDPTARCKHLLLARDWLLDEVLDKLREQRTETET